MKKLLLLLTLSAGILLTGCNKKELANLDDRVASLQEQLDNAYALLSENDTLLEEADDALAALIAGNTANITSNATEIDGIQEDIADAEEAYDAVVDRIVDLETANTNQNSIDGALARAVAALQAADVVLVNDIGALSTRVETLEDINVTYGNWAPLFGTRTANFTQTGDTFFGTELIGTDNVTRSITVTSTINVVEEVSTEQALFLTGVTSATADVNNDGTHHGQIFRYRPDRVYTGTVSGTGEVVGRHTVLGQWSDWITNRILTN